MEAIEERPRHGHVIRDEVFLLLEGHGKTAFQPQSKPEYNPSDGHLGSGGPSQSAMTEPIDTKTDEDTDMKEHDPEPLSRDTSNDGLEDEVLVECQLVKTKTGIPMPGPV